MLSKEDIQEKSNVDSCNTTTSKFDSEKSTQNGTNLLDVEKVESNVDYEIHTTKCSERSQAKKSNTKLHKSTKSSVKVLKDYERGSMDQVADVLLGAI